MANRVQKDVVVFKQSTTPFGGDIITSEAMIRAVGESLEVPLTVEFGHDSQIGTATLTEKGAVIVAELSTKYRNKSRTVEMYPALKIETDTETGAVKRILECSLCSTPNSDTSIPPIKIEL